MYYDEEERRHQDYILHKYYEIYACFMEVFYDDYVICNMIYD